MNSPLVKVSNLSSGYGIVDVLHEVNLELNAGEIVSIIGANGAGKTTLLKTITGFLPVSKGQVHLYSEDITGYSADQMVTKGLAHVPEGRKIFARMSVKENLELGAYAFNLKASEIRQRISEITDLFPVLGERLKQMAGTLSGGEQQMLALGRAMMSKPKVLLLDEPSMGIAPLLVKKIFETIQLLNKSGISVLLVEQDANQALSISDRAYVLETGRIVLTGKASELMDNQQIKEAYLGA